jgi:hypothetical protein
MRLIYQNLKQWGYQYHAQTQKCKFLLILGSNTP